MRGVNTDELYRSPQVLFPVIKDEKKVSSTPPDNAPARPSPCRLSMPGGALSLNPDQE